MLDVQIESIQNGNKIGSIETYQIDDIGDIRYEVYDDCMFIHPRILKPLGGASFRRYRDIVLALTPLVMDEWDHELLWIHTNNTQIIDMIGQKNIQEYGDIHGATLYFVHRDDLEWSI